MDRAPDADAGGDGPGLSVVIPLYNKRDYIRGAVAGVLRQTQADFELIVVDDGSTDDGLATIRDIADPRLRIISQSNQGVAAARNRGIAEARAPWVALLDADDAWTPDHLAETVAMIRAHPDAGIVSTAVRQIRDGRYVEAFHPGPHRIREVDYFREGTGNILIVLSSTATLRRTAVQSIGGFRDLRPGEDIDCWARMALRWPVVVSSRQTAEYRRDTSGAMAAWASWTIPAAPFEKLAQFGGTIEVIGEALATGRFEHRRRGMEDYMDARILSGIGKCLVTGDSIGARQRLRFVSHRTTARYWTYRLAAMLPRSTIRLAVAAFRRIRRRGRNRSPAGGG